MAGGAVPARSTRPRDFVTIRGWAEGEAITMAQSGIAESEAAPLLLPPVYAPVEAGPDDDPLTVARDLAGSMDAGATFVWARRADRAECAIVLAPDRPLSEALKVVYVAHAGIGDALGALVPPAVDVAFDWPDRIRVNGAVAGGFRLVFPDGCGPSDVPDWMVLGLSLRMMPGPDGEDPGRTPDRTTMYDEGCGDLTAAAVLESFARHFLYWINRWDEDGFGAVQASWLPRAAGREDAEMFRVGDLSVEGTIFSLDKDGGLVVKTETGMETLPLAAALSTPARDFG